MGKRKLTFLAEFSQCFGGGFLTEMGNQGVVGYGTNSASAYFETASYNPPAKNSFYPFAWQSIANVPAAAVPPTDEWITWKAYDAIDPTLGAVGAIPKNRNAAFERAQYRSDRVGGVPQALGSAMHNVDGLDIGAGKYGQPISFPHEEPWPGSPYPNQPYPGDEPTPPYPLPPYNPYP
jgi:hypothetical protein